MILRTKFIYLLFLMFLTVVETFAQKPVINSISKNSSTVNESITISGSGFGTNAANLKVSFGAVNAQIASVTDNLLKVKVPAGVTHNSIAVTNISSGLTGYSSNQFGISFGGVNFDLTKLGSQQDFSAGAGLFDLCLCDFDNDGKSDVATANDGAAATDIGVYKNASTMANINFSARQAVSLGVSTATKNINCGDIDGDGKPDLVVSGAGEDYGNTIFIYRNTSTATGAISFAAPITKTIGTNAAARIAIRDIDLDGKPELVITNRSENVVSIFPNTSAIGSISFAAAETVTVSAAPHTNGLAVEDLDNDGLPELIVNPSQDKDVFIFKNNSTSGTISFQSSPVVLAGAAGLVNLAVGDLNEDGKPDIAVTNVLDNRVRVYKNESISTIAFSAAHNIGTDTAPWGLTLGDVDGNGTTDVIVAFSQSKYINVLLNASTSSGFDFTKKSIATSEKTRNVKFGDLNGDAKPDFVFTSTETSQMSVIKNAHCLVPTITPDGPHAICSDAALVLTAPNGLGVSYLWHRNGSPLASETNSSITPDQNGTYTVKATSDGGCEETSQAVEVTIDSGDGLGAIAFDPIAAVCVGDAITLSATEISGAEYHWSGPDGYSATTTTHTATISNVSSSKSGEYYVIIEKGACSSQTLTSPNNAEVHALPSPEITPLTSPSFCDPGAVELSAGAGFDTYQWKKDGVDLPGAQSASYTATTSGNYSVVVKNGNGCSNESAAIAVNAYSPPTASFSTKSITCVGQEISFENTSTVQGDGASYFWDFGDGATSEEENPTHTFEAVGENYEVTLTVSYSPDCKDEYTKEIEVIEAPEVAIIAEGSLEFCMGDSVKLSVPEGYRNYIWSNGKTTPSIYAKKDGNVNVTVVTDEGCSINSSINLKVLPFPEISISSDKTLLKPGESVQLFATGAHNYTWSPEEGLSDPTASDPIAAPAFTTTYTVTGIDDIGCSGATEITIVVDNELSVTPPKLYVPAADNYWQIEQMEYYPECNVIIFSKQGVKLYEQKDYANNPWDGTYKGQPLSEGVYYFVIRCEGNSNDKTGSITLMR